jgi:hypothetical protein
MAWSSPKTWTTGELVTAANMNQEVRDNIQYVLNQVRAGIALLIRDADFSNDAAGNKAAARSTITGGASNPLPRWQQLEYDDSTTNPTEYAYWSFVMPANYIDTPQLNVHYKMASANVADEVVLKTFIFAVSDGDASDMDVKDFATEDTTVVAVPDTAGYADVTTLSITQADSLAAGDFVILGLARHGANASDTADGDCEVYGVELIWAAE